MIVLLISTTLHHLDQPHNVVDALAQGEKGLFDEIAVLAKLGAADAAQHVHVFLRQLERRQLKADGARAVGQHETKVNVDQVAVVIQQDIAIVATN